jgi:shikimate dehydrogenase
MHNAALAELGLAPEWSYEAIDVAPEGFAALVTGLEARGYKGANVTVPHKLAALEAADEASPAAREIGAANTLTLRGGRIEAENTDAIGILDALPESPAGMRALVMGAGGSARAAIWALKNAGADVHVWNRTEAKAAALADEFAVRLAARGRRDAAASRKPKAESFDLLLNATTVGLESAGPSDLKDLPLDADQLHASQVVVDLVYGANETQLIAAARAVGGSPVDGLEILVRQGAASLGIWTGAEPPLEVMRAAARGEVSS